MHSRRGELNSPAHDTDKYTINHPNAETQNPKTIYHKKKGSERTNAPNPMISINLKTYFL